VFEFLTKYRPNPESDDNEELLYVYSAIMKLSPGFVMVLDACKCKPTLVLAFIAKVSAYMRLKLSTGTYNAYRLLRPQTQLAQMIQHV
jgi:hypothetical protein